MTVSTMHRADLAAVTRLEAEAGTNGWTRAMFADELERPDRLALVATTLPREVLAAATFMLVLDEVHVTNVVVGHARRRQGIASRLLLEGCAWAVRRGAVAATLEVRESREGARRLYERLGFTAVGRRPGYYAGPREDAVIMTAAGLRGMGSVPARCASDGEEAACSS